MPDTAACTASLYISHKNNTHCVCFMFTDKLMNKLAWKVGDVLSVAEGTGTDAHCLSIEKATNNFGYKLLQSSKGSLSSARIHILISRFKHYTFNSEQSIQQHTLTEQAFGGRLIVMLPDWFNYKGPVV